MLPERRFLNQPRSFWANVRTIAQKVGYTERGKGLVKIPTISSIGQAFSQIGLGVDHLVDTSQKLTPLGRTLLDYFSYRAEALNEFVEPRLMGVERARKEFERLRVKHKPTCPLPMNKQKGKKKSYAYLTCIVNTLVEAYSNRQPCDYDPRELTTVTQNHAPLRTLARRVDGAFPSVVNPIAIWETKEYYYTTTFGSRVADGVYETLLDGMEIEELKEHEGIDVKHYLIIDAHYTWWDCGKSYLCRMMDMLHMGYVDEILFGYEVIERLPAIVREWVALARSR